MWGLLKISTTPKHNYGRLPEGNGHVLLRDSELNTEETPD